MIDATQAEIANQNAQQSQAQTSSAISAGAYGGDRAGVAQAVLAGQQDLASNQTLANLNSSNYSQALAAAQQQQGVSLSADQANRAAVSTAAGQEANLASLTSSTGIANSSAQLAAGTLQQQTQQAQDTAAYGQFENAQAFPYQQASYLAGITGSLAPELGSTNTGSGTSVSSPPNPLNAIIGGGLGLLSLSDKRAKEDIKPIGKTFDGQMLYSFKYKGEPATHVGLIAQEVEKKTPDAVGKRGDGMRVVDYAEATRKAAEKGHFARGGRAMDAHDVVRMYATGGTPGGTGVSGMSAFPYDDPNGGYVPAEQLSSKALPVAQAPQQPGQPATSAPDPSAALLNQGIKAFAGSSTGQSLGDSISDFAQDNLGFARGGNVLDFGSARAKRGYDIGGLVTPDAENLMFDPAIVSDPTGGSLGEASPMSLPTPTGADLSGISNLPAGRSNIYRPDLGTVNALQPGVRNAPTIPATLANLPDSGPSPVVASDAPTPLVPQTDVSQLPAPPVPVSLGSAGAPTAPNTITAPPSMSAGDLGTASSPPPVPVSAAPDPTGVQKNFGAAPADPASPANASPLQGGFDGAVKQTLGFEGGFNAKDANGAPVNFGINQAAHPEVDVSKLTADQARAIYKKDYWDKINGDNLSPALGRVAFDTAVVAGVGRANDWIKESGGDPNKFMALRSQYLNGLVQSDPARYGQYAKAWANRDASLVATINGAAPDASTPASSGNLGSAADAAPIPVRDNTTAPTKLSDYFGSAIGGTGTPSPGHSGGAFGLFPGLSDNARMSLAAAGFGMAASGSRSVGQALGQGGAQGVAEYNNLQKLQIQQAQTQADIARVNAQAKDIPAARTQEGSRIDVLQKELSNKLAQTQQEIKESINRINIASQKMPSEIEETKARIANLNQTSTPQGILAKDHDPTKTRFIPYDQMPGMDLSGGNAPASGPATTIPGSVASDPSRGPQGAASVVTAPSGQSEAAPPKTALPGSPPPDQNGFVDVPARLPISSMTMTPHGQQRSAEATKQIMDDARNGFQASQDMKFNLGRMKHEFDALPTSGYLAAGPGQQQRARIARLVNSTVTSLIPGTNPNDLPNADAISRTEDLNKLTKYMGFNLSGSMGNKAGFIVQEAVGAVPSSENSALGAKRLVAGLNAAAQRQEDRYKFLSHWEQKSGGDATPADEAFNKANPPQKYVAQAILSTVDPRDLATMRAHADNPAARSKFDQIYGPGTSNYALGKY